ncbi:hypothetical protein PI125_g24402 [Phytophthora idaei]|nr:hypothetical protein PI125_g24402 [Phytophthora idaei]
MAASAAEQWATTTDITKQVVGSLLQGTEGEADAILLSGVVLDAKLRDSMWKTGIPVVAAAHESTGGLEDTGEEEEAEVRCKLRFSNGATTRWCSDGLTIALEQLAAGPLLQLKQEREKNKGRCLTDTIGELPFRVLHLRDAQGQRRPWQGFQLLIENRGLKKMRELILVRCRRTGVVVCSPGTMALPLSSNQAHLFREIGLSIIAQFPELTYKAEETQWLQVHHGVDERQESKCILHQWGNTEQRIWDQNEGPPPEKAIAQMLQVSESSVWVSPHPTLTRMRPLWVGKRRWKRSRKQYRAMLSTKSIKKALEGQKEVVHKGREQHKALADALELLTWKQFHHVEGLTQYRKQNWLKLKAWKLRLWRRDVKGYRCASASCGDGDGGQEHLAWSCPEAQAFWTTWMEAWGQVGVDNTQGQTTATFTCIFSLEIQRVPAWLQDWGADQDDETWAVMHDVAQTLWERGCVATITTIWRRNINNAHPEETIERSLEAAVARWRAAISDVFARYRLSLFPLKGPARSRLAVVDAIRARWVSADRPRMEGAADSTERVAFFDGGSRGNPGPGGSGSVVVELGGLERRPTVVWGAATSLCQRTTTNNIVEFVGLHRVLQHAHHKKWQTLHIVGDSAMILGVMADRRTPRSRKLRWWYEKARLLADKCNVASWTHHYRQFNKTADKLANIAMDTKRSIVYDPQEGPNHALMQVVQDRITGDITRWLEGRNAED